MTEPAVARGWQLVRRPVGVPRPEDFHLAEVDVPELPDGEVRVRNAFLSVDPYMRGRMNDARSYAPPYALGEVMTGGAVGRVVASRDDRLPEGTTVLHDRGWRDVAQGPARLFRPVVTPAGLRDSVHLGPLGMVGLTAWAGLVEVAGMRTGDVVFVSGAAGAVGSLAGQIARLRGAGKVIGSAGSDHKVDVLVERYGFDAAFNYHAAPVRDQLRQVAPDGIDVYFDNVGGDHLEAAIDAFREFGRAAVCGAVSSYNATEPPAAPRNLSAIIGKGVTLRGFLVVQHQSSAARAAAEIGGWLTDGRLVADETVVRGLPRAVEAFLDMLGGANTGKMLVAL
ncbi:NADP-dependent oxidoreductase [Nakamurella endophytica]|uniref:NADP-dependent oxidoreductase n=1 Tax=Nakamurella endophytica TaxID=1748367 RepID=A0A917SNF7_9ACTN|nr:NADP-dependent oxidoreductase [Nakamurella endophytica]GGL88408.1 NADP-dependent oxidoreductase [Nakamurella endophytica]